MFAMHWRTCWIVVLLTMALVSTACTGCKGQEAPAAATPDEAVSSEEIEQSLVAAERYFDAGKLPEAEIILSELIDRGPVSVTASEMLARVIFTKAALAEQSYRFDEARALYDEAADRYARVVELEPDHAGWRQNAGDFAVAAGRIEAAIEHYAEAERVDPVNPRHPLYRAQLLLQARRIDEAEAAAIRAVELEGASAHAVATLASVRFEQGQHGEAMSLIHEARELARADEEVDFRVMEARFARRTDRPDLSIQLLTPLSPADRVRIAVAEELAAAYHAQGDHDAALGVWTRAFNATADWKAALGAADAAIRADLLLQAESWLDIAGAIVGDHSRVKEIRTRLTTERDE